MMDSPKTPLESNFLVSWDYGQAWFTKKDHKSMFCLLGHLRRRKLEHAIYVHEKAPDEKLGKLEVEASLGWTQKDGYQPFPEWVENQHVAFMNAGFIGLTGAVVGIGILTALTVLYLLIPITPHVIAAFVVALGLGGIAILQEVEKRTTIDKKRRSFRS